MSSYTHFTQDEREKLQKDLKKGKSMRQIAEELGRSPSSVSREVKRNFSKTKGWYHAWHAYAGGSSHIALFVQEHHNGTI